MRGKCLKFLVAIIVLDLSSVELEWKLYVFWGHSCHCFFCIFACGPCVQFSTGLDRSYALFFKLSLSTFLFLLFLNAFFTACNYRVVMFLRHFTPKKRFPVLPVYCLYPDISQLWKTKNLVACLFKWVMNKELLVTKL